MGSICSRLTSKGEVTWRAVIRLKGFPDFSKTFKDKKEAELWVQKTEGSLRAQHEIPKFTLNQFFDRLEVDILPKKNPKYVHKELPYIKFWREHLGNKIATDITPSEIETKANLLYGMKSRFGVPYSPETRRKYIQTLSFLYNTAIKHWRWALTNPTSHVDLHVQAIKDWQSNTKKIISSGTWQAKKKEFLECFYKQLRKNNIPDHVGLDMMKFFNMSKHSLQHVIAEDTNTTIKSLFYIADKLGITIEFRVQND